MSGAGKTTVARRLARRHGLRCYSGDARTWEHRDAAIRAGNESAIRFETMTHAERLATLAASPAEFLKLNLDFERGPLTVEDLRRLPRAPLIVADSSTIMPELISQRHAERGRAVWLLAPYERHRAYHEAQDMAHLVEYRWLIAEEVERQAAEVGANVLRLDERIGMDDALAAVEQLFADALTEGPRAQTLEERRALLREANEAVVAQARGFLARPWATGDETTFTREFLCECDDPECTELVELAVADYAPGLSAHR